MTQGPDLGLGYVGSTQGPRDQPRCPGTKLAPPGPATKLKDLGTKTRNKGRDNTKGVYLLYKPKDTGTRPGSRDQTQGLDRGTQGSYLGGWWF